MVGDGEKGNLLAAKRHKERKKKTQKNLTQRRKGEDKTNREWTRIDTKKGRPTADGTEEVKGNR
jgi:hypothetical protein